MLSYLLRTLPVVLRARRRSGLVSRVQGRVWPSLIDTNLHMNQAAYAQVLELGRNDWFFRTGAWKAWGEQDAHVVVAEQRIVYRRELEPFARYWIDTRAVGVEGRLALMQGVLCVGERVHALNEVKLIFVGEEGVLDPARVPPLVEPYLAEPLPVTDWVVDPSALP